MNIEVKLTPQSNGSLVRDRVKVVVTWGDGPDEKRVMEPEEALMFARQLEKTALDAKDLSLKLPWEQ